MTPSDRWETGKDWQAAILEEACRFVLVTTTPIDDLPVWSVHRDSGIRSPLRRTAATHSRPRKTISARFARAWICLSARLSGEDGGGMQCMLTRRKRFSFSTLFPTHFFFLFLCVCSFFANLSFHEVIEIGIKERACSSFPLFTFHHKTGKYLRHAKTNRKKTKPTRQVLGMSQ